jgi:hypothetical protein
LLSGYGSHMRMMFVDNPRSWYLDSRQLDFDQFVAAQPEHRFLDFVNQHFKQLARVSKCRLLVRKERTDLDLFDCAYEAGSDSKDRGRAHLRLKLPHERPIGDVHTIELVDIDHETRLASTELAGSLPRLVLTEGSGRTLLANPDKTPSSTSFGPDQRLFVSYPAGLRLADVAYPALRFFDGQGKRLLTLPVAVDTCLAKPR